MYTLQKISVLASFLGLWLTSYLSDKNQIIVGFILIFTFGILHGANDLVLIDQIKTKTKYTFFKILLSYVVVVLLSVVLFIQLPVFALLLFIFVSGYHFGEQHWQNILVDSSTTGTKVFELSYGLLLLLLLFYFNTAEVIAIIMRITGFTLSANSIQILLLIAIAFFIIYSYYIYQHSQHFKKNSIEQLFYIILLSIIFKASSLIWGFALYFIFWHSIPSLHDQIRFLYGTYSFTNFKKYFASAFLYWFISLVGIMLLYFVSKDMLIFDALFFSFLASITFPHAMVILKMYKK